MRISFNGGLYVVFRLGTPDRSALGFKVKPRSKMLFSERIGARRGFTFGPLWIGTFSLRGRP